MRNPQGERSEEWRLCQPCYWEVRAEARRAGLRSPYRLRIALAVVASRHDRRPPAPRTGDDFGGEAPIGRTLKKAALALGLYALLFVALTLFVTLHL